MRQHARTRRTPVVLVSAVALLLASACSDSGEEVVTAETTTTAAPTTTEATTTTVAPTTTEAPTTTAAPTTTEPPVETGIVLAATGLTVVPLGASAANAIAALSDELGPPVADEPMAECPSGADRSVRWPDLALVFSGDVLVGWHHAPRPPAAPVTMPLATAEGIAIGSTEAEVLAAYPGASIDESSLGTELSVEGAAPGTYLGGLLTGPGGTVTDLWAGDICAFR